MKRTTKVLWLLLACALMIAALTVTAFAASKTGTSPVPDPKLASTSSGSDFKYQSGGATVYSTADQTLADVIGLADSGSEILFLNDIVIKTPTYSESTKAYCYIDKPLTLNLNGYTLYFSQSHKDSFISITTTEQVTIKNGTAVWNVNQDYLTQYNRSFNTSHNQTSFALFSAKKDGAKVKFSDMTTYGSVLLYSYSNKNVEVEIDGGEYHVMTTCDLLGNTLFDMRANAKVTISNAFIDLKKVSDSSIFILTSYKHNNSDVGSSATLTNCDIISSSTTANILKYMNSHTTVDFNNCRIYGSITPTQHGNDKTTSYFETTGPIPGSIRLNGGTLYSSEATMLDDVVVTDPDCTLVGISETRTYAIKTTTGTIFNADSITFATSSNSGSYYFDTKVQPPATKYTVNFYGEDGYTLISTMTVEEGSEATPPAYDSIGGSNGWYKVGFDGWTTVFGSSYKVTDFTITKDTNFYPAATETEGALVVDLSGAKYNLSFTGSIILNLYLPKVPAGVRNVKVTDESGNVISGKNVMTTQGGADVYYKLYEIANISPARITENTTVTVSFIADGTELSKNITLSPVKYAQTILADSEKNDPVWNAETYAMMADMLRYSNELSNAAGLGYVSTLNSLLNTYGKLCTPTYANNSFSELTTSMYALNGYVTSVQFAISEFKPQWIINLDTSKYITDVYITVNGYFPETKENGANYGTITYGLDESKTVMSGSYIKTAYIESMPIYNMDGDITITVKLSSGTTKSATYNLATYYTGMDVSGDTLHNWQKFLQAFRAFAGSSSSYKYSEGIIAENAPTKDFFDCDHANAKTKTLNSSALTTGRYCSTCETYIFFYDDFINTSGKGGAIYYSRDDALSGKENSYSAIDYCHAKANTRASSGYKVGCVATPGAVYYLGYSYDYSGSIDEITVSTDTQWDGAYIISDESTINVGDTAFNKPLFCVRGFDLTINGKKYSKSGTTVTSYFSSDIKAGTTKLPFAPGAPMMLYLYDSSVKHYIRNGANENSGVSQTELILIDEFGNVSNTTPIEWDYTYNSSSSVFYVKAYTITDAPLKISGLDENGNISATFENIANNAVDATAYKSCGRNIVARRSNVTIEGIYHELTEDDTNLTPRQAYSTFKAWYAYNVVFKDLSVKQHLGHYIQNADGTNTSNSIGSYEFLSEDSVYVSWINCKVRNFFNSDGSIKYKGLFGTNRSKNMYLRDCFLPSFDAHSGAGNVTIENSTFEHINFIGAGDIRINTVTVYQTTGGLAAIILRQDYGSRWRGNVYFDGLELRYDPDVYTADYIDLVRAYYTNWDFGYGTAQGSNERPANIYANNVSIMEYSRKAYGNSTVTFDKDGKVYESTLKKGTRMLGIYTQLNKQLTNSSYDYSTINSNNKNPMGCTKNIYITNSDVTLKYPTHKFFKDMKIYIDGVQQNWY